VRVLELVESLRHRARKFTGGEFQEKTPFGFRQSSEDFKAYWSERGAGSSGRRLLVLQRFDDHSVL